MHKVEQTSVTYMLKDCILEKSVSCQKKDGRGHEHPSFFWYDNDKDLKVCFLVMRIIWPLD